MSLQLIMWDKGTDAREASRESSEVWVEAYRSPAGTYYVSNLGRACSNLRSRGLYLLKTTRSSAGYATIGIYDSEGETATRTLHRLVIESFDGPCTDPKKTDVCHIDSNPDNNALDNLVYGTRGENMRQLIQARRAGLSGQTLQFDIDGKAWTWYNVPNDGVLQASMDLYGEGKLTISDLARVWGTTETVARNVLLGDAFTHLRRPELREQKKRAPALLMKIRALIREGRDREYINAVCDTNLSSQDMYYYKQTSDR